MTSLFYIRYLKPPPTVVSPGKPFTIAWTVTNDLGEIPYWQPLIVKCRLVSNLAASPLQLQLASSSPSQSTKKKLDQKNANQMEYDPIKGGGTMITSLIVTGTATRPNIAIQLVLELANGELHPQWSSARRLENDWIIPVWSLPSQLSGKASGSSATREYERQVSVDNQVIKIHEDASPSMGSHLWDCGLLMCQYLTENRLPRYATVIELGSGTGIAGIYYAHLLKPSKMYLTDLADTVPTIKHNFGLQKSPKGVQSVVEELEWGTEHKRLKVDLVLLADVIYNSASHGALLTTLQRLMDDNPAMHILLGYKRRNEEEEKTFFDNIKRLGWQWKMTSLPPAEFYLITRQ